MSVRLSVGLLVRPSVCPSVGPYVGPLVGNGYTFRHTKSDLWRLYDLDLPLARAFCTFYERQFESGDWIVLWG